MSINMSNVKAITLGGQNVKKIENSQGVILWQQATPQTIYNSRGRGGSDYNQYSITNKTWYSKTWGTSLDARIDGRNIWSDGTNLYCSNSSYGQYVLNETTMEWETKTWSGVSNLNADYIWTDGTNIYYSYNTTQKVLMNGSWVKKSWTGLSSFTGNSIWTDGTKIYYANGSSHYVLNTSTSTWSTQLWAGSFKNFHGYNTWTDGTNIYCSNGSSTYRLLYWSETELAWSQMTVTGTTSFNGARTFKYNGDIYVIESSSPYQMYKLTSSDTSQVTWAREVFTDQPTASSNIRGDCMWDLNGSLTSSCVCKAKKIK